MKKNKHYIFLLLCSVFVHIAQCQKSQPFKVKKNPGDIYFFQKGKASDTVSKNKGDLFYLVVPDSLKKSISVLVENGQLLPTANDSILTLNYIPGLKYESLYTATDHPKAPSLKKYTDNNRHQAQGLEFKTLINGPSGYTPGKIFIQIYNKKTEKIILENALYYRN